MKENKGVSKEFPLIEARVTIPKENENMASLCSMLTWGEEK